MNTALTLDNQPRAAKQARRFIGEQLTGLDPHLIARVTLMVSELVTNSIRYTNGPLRITLDLTADSVRIEVIDGGPGRPTLRAPRTDEATGRGLGIVAELADDWGVEHDPASGNMVWFCVTGIRLLSSLDVTAQSRVQPRVRAPR